MFTLGAAVDLAVAAHSGQERTLTGGRTEPYVSHPMRVMAGLHDELGRTVAVLHDVIEDTAFSANALRAANVPAKVIEVVLVLTRRAGEPYEGFIDRIIEYGEPATSVKRADIADNLASLHGPWEHLRPQYRAAFKRLREDGPVPPLKQRVMSGLTGARGASIKSN